MNHTNGASDDRLLIRWGGWSLHAVLITACAAVLILPSLWGVVQGETKAIPILLLGLLPLGCAIFLLTGGQSVIDRRAASVRRERRLPGMSFLKKDARLSGFNLVTVREFSRATGRGQFTFYAVQLESAESHETPHAGYGEECFEVFRSWSYRKSRLAGKQVAQFTGLTLMDYGESSDGVLREPNELNQTVHNALNNSRERPTWPDAPPKCRVRVKAAGDTIIFRLPRIGARGKVGFVIGLVISAVFLGQIVWPRFFDKSWTVFDGDDWGLLAVGGLVLAVVICAALQHRRIKVSPRELRATTYLLAPVYARSIRTDELEELLLQPAEGCLMARSDRQTIKFGSWLSDEERSWLYAAFVAAMAGALPPTEYR